MATTCSVCGGAGGEVVYAGPIRSGRFGSLTERSFELVRCAACGSISLPPEAAALAADYESGAYRASVDGSADPAHFLALHAAEQPGNLEAAGGESALAGVRLADVGCGAGAFLETVRHAVSEGIGIEPDSIMRASLAERGIEAYPYASEAVSARPGSVDLAVSFATIEHVTDPLGFLSDVRELLRPGGRVVLTTPNHDDLLLELAAESYRPFFYRTAHLHYFDARSLSAVLERAGFERVKVRGRHRFGLSNALAWLRDGRPSGDAAWPGVTGQMDAAWRCELERTLRSDFLIAEAYRP